MELIHFTVVNSYTFKLELFTGNTCYHSHSLSFKYILKEEIHIIIGKQQTLTHVTYICPTNGTQQRLYGVFVKKWFSFHLKDNVMCVTVKDS